MTTTKTKRQAETVEVITNNTAEALPTKIKPIKPAVRQAPPSPNRKREKSSPRKPEIIFRLIKRSKGARIQDLQKATGWQAHSIRAALTGLRKQGVRIDHSRTPSGKTIYKAVEG